MHPRDIQPGLPPRSAEKLRQWLEQLSDPDRVGATWPMQAVADEHGPGVQFGLDMTYEDWRPWLDMPPLTADTDDLDIFNFNWLLIDLSASWNLTGMQRGTAGVKVLLTNTSSLYSLTIKNLATGSQAWNRFHCAGGTDFVLGPGQTALASHDGTQWWIGQWAGGDSPTFGGPMTVDNYVFVEGSVITGLTSGNVTTILTNLTKTQINQLNQLNACQWQAFLTLTNVQQQSIATNLTSVQIGQLFANIITSNVSIVTSLLTTLTTTQLQTFTTNFSSSIFTNTAVTTTRMESFLQNVTSANIATLVGILTQQQVSQLLITLTDAQITLLIVNLTSTQLIDLTQYTTIQISNLVNQLTTSQLKTFLNLFTSVMDWPVYFSGLTTTSTNATNNNVSVANISYLSWNPTGSSATVTGFVPTSPVLPQKIVVTNANGTHNLTLVYNSGGSTYPIKNPTGADYLLKPLTSVPLIYDPTLQLWIILTAPEAPSSTAPSLRLFAVTADQTVANTVVNTSILGGTCTLSANSANEGSTICIDFGGFLSYQSTIALTVEVLVNGSTATSFSLSYSSGDGTTTWRLTGVLTFRSTGASGSLEPHCDGWDTVTEMWEGANSNPTNNTITGLDTTSSITVDVKVQWGTASASDSLTCNTGLVTFWP